MGGKAGHKTQLHSLCASYARAVGAQAGYAVLPHALLDFDPAWKRRTTVAGLTISGLDVSSFPGSMLWRLGATDILYACQQPQAVSRLRFQATSKSGLGQEAGKVNPADSKHLEEDSDSVPADGQSAEHELDSRRLHKAMAACQQTGALRIFCWVLSHAFRWLFGSKIVVNEEGLAQVKRLDQTHTIVYAVTHKSYVDFLMLSYVLHSQGLQCPLIAAGENLRLPLLHHFLRRSGAFFIRRDVSARPDAAHYRHVFAGYIRSVLEASTPLEFFIEGGRSRDGRILPPRRGLLSMIIDTALDGDLSKGIAVVPVAISYDAVLEENSMAAELTGVPKARESLGIVLISAVKLAAQQLCLLWRGSNAVGVPMGFCGTATVSFGEPISVKRYLRDRAKHRKRPKAEVELKLEAATQRNTRSIDIDVLTAAVEGKPAVLRGLPSPLSLEHAFPKGGEQRRHAVEALGEEITARLRRSNVIPASALLAAAVHFLEASSARALASSRGCLRSSGPVLACAEVAQTISWLAGELQHRQARYMGLECGDTPSAVARLASCSSGWLAMEEDSNTVSVRLLPGAIPALRLQYRLNQLLPPMVSHALIAAAMLAAVGPPGSSGSDAGIDEGELLGSAVWLRAVLAAELDSCQGPAVLRSTEAFAAEVDSMVEDGSLVRSEALFPGCSARLRWPSAGESRRVSLFAASLLAPLVATYCASLSICVQQLHSSGEEGLTASQLIHRIEEALLSGSHTAAVRPVPSIFLLKGSIQAWMRLGVLVESGSGTPITSPARHPLKGAASCSNVSHILQRSESMATLSPGQQASSPSTRDASNGIEKPQIQERLLLGPNYLEGEDALLYRLQRYIYRS